MQGLDRYHWAVGEILSPENPSKWHRDRRVGRKVAELSKALRFARGATVGHDYLADPETLRGYLAWFVPWNLLRIEAVLAMHRSLPRVLRGNEGGHIVDLGAGPLVSALHLALFRPELQEKPLVFHAVDSCAEAIEAGREVLARVAPKHRWTIRPVTLGFDDVFEDESHIPWSEVGLVIDTFSLNEWARGRVRRKKLLTLIEAFRQWLPAGADVLCIEPGNREAGRLLPALRGEVLRSGPQHIMGPCTHRSDCPLIRTRDRSWCHFRRDVDAPPWLADVGESAGLPKERLFQSYLWWRHGESPEKPQSGEDLPARIIGEPMSIGRGEEGVYACDVTGRVLLSWRWGERPPPERLENGRVVKRPRSERGRKDGRSGALVVPFPAAPVKRPRKAPS